MDDIYSELENYNDVQEIEELRLENKDLKFKLDKRTTEIQKLQADFDNLTKEYKRLELNYSSLLKTAKAEVERKTQMISNLNLEKDAIVLSSIQNITRTMCRDMSNSFNKNKKDAEAACRKSEKNEIPKGRGKERKEEKRLASIDTVSSTPTPDDTNKFDNKREKLDSYIDTKAETKDSSKTKLRSQSIKSRRKSLPAFGKHLEKFSSDEENNEYSADIIQDTREDRCRRPGSSGNYVDKVHKVSETSGIDDKYSSYHESSRETNYKSTYRISDRYRSNRDKYEQSQRNIRQFSPDRLTRRPREFSGDRFKRAYRVLESPPLERYDSQRRFHNRRVAYDRDPFDRDPYDRDVFDRDPYNEKLKHRRETYAMKHKIQEDLSEPAIKRSRTDNMHLDDHRRWHNNDDLTDDPVRSGFVKQLQISCQSPDYIYSEVVSTQPKEIMNTASTKLEDPRLTSQKYVLRTLQDDKTILSTTVGRTLDLKVVAKSTWDIERVDLPEALRKPPEHIDKDVQEPDIENPVFKASFTPDEMQMKDSRVIENKISYNFCEIQRYSEDVAECTTVKLQENKIESLYRKVNSKHKTPGNDKTSTPEDTVERKKVKPLSILLQDMDKSIENSKESIERELYNLEMVPRNTRASSTKQVLDVSIFGKDDIDASDKARNANLTHILNDKKILSYREIVESDLHLSDETSDNIEIQKQAAKEENKTRRSKKLTLKKVCDERVETVLADNIKEPTDKDTDKVSSSTKKLEQVEDKSLHASDKKHKTKKKSRKLKSSPKIKLNPTLEKSRHKKGTKPKEIKSKFSDLFGDSSSLITPEDLGILTESPQVVSTANYVPMFEDAVDAVDVDKMKVQQTDTKLDSNDLHVEERHQKKPIVENKSSGAFMENKKTKLKVMDATPVLASAKETEKSMKMVIKKCKSTEVFTVESSADITRKKPSETSEIQIVQEELVFSHATKTTKDTVNCNILTEPRAEKKAYDYNKHVEEVKPLNLTEHTIEKDNLSNNLNYGRTKMSPVVSTVIISTGVQHNVTDMCNVQNHVDIEDKMRQPLVGFALATSTPYKDFMLNSDNNEVIPESSCTSADSKLTRNNTTSAGDPSSPKNGITSRNDNVTDVPDVRIFVRRKKRVLKKASP